jgi:hypothetical protein
MMNKVPGGKATSEEKSLSHMSKFLIEVTAVKRDLMVPKFSSVTISSVILFHNLAKVNGSTSEEERTAASSKSKVHQESIFTSVVLEFGTLKAKKKRVKLERRDQPRSKEKNLSQKVEMKKIQMLTKLILLKFLEKLLK